MSVTYKEISAYSGQEQMPMKSFAAIVEMIWVNNDLSGL